MLMGLSANAQAWSPGAEIHFEAVPSFEYEEPDVMSQEGQLFGLGGAYTWRNNATHVRLDLAYLTGDTDYDGQTWSGIPATSTADDDIYLLQARIGENIGSVERPIIPFAGIGHRMWRQDLKDGRDAGGNRVLGYERGHDYTYFTAGVIFGGDTPSASWRLGGEVQPLLSGEARADLPNHGSQRLSMDSGYGLQLHARIQTAISDRVNLFGETYWQRWDISRSERKEVAPDVIVVEPENTTDTYGVRFGLGF